MNGSINFTPAIYSIMHYTQPLWIQSHMTGAPATVLAREIHGKMVTKPQLSAVVQCIKQLRDTYVNAGDPQRPDLEVPILSFAPNQRGMAWTELARESSVDRLMAAFAETMSYPGATPQTFVYTKSHPTHPLILKTIRNDPRDTNPPLVIHDPNYYDSCVRRMTENTLNGVHDSTILDDLTVNVPQLDFDHVWSTTHDVVLNIDADDFGAIGYAKIQRLTMAEMTEDIPMSARRQWLACLDTYGGRLDHMYEYPACFIPMLLGTDVDARARDRTSSVAVQREYLISVASDAIKAQQKKARM